MWTCNYCSRSNQDDGEFCSYCGNAKYSQPRKRTVSPKLIIGAAAAIVLLAAALIFAKPQQPAAVSPNTVAVNSPSVKPAEKPSENPAETLPSPYQNYERLASMPADDVYIWVSRKYGDLGDHMLVSYGDNYKKFDFPWHAKYGIEFFVNTDLDHDGKDEYVLCTSGIGGTGIKLEEIYVFNISADGSIRGAHLDIDTVGQQVRDKCFAGRLGEDYILLRELTDNGQTFKRLEAGSLDDCGVSLKYKLHGDKISAEMSMQFDYSVNDQIYLFSNDLDKIFSGYPESPCIFADGKITADLVYDGKWLSLENIVFPGSYVDPSTLS